MHDLHLWTLTSGMDVGTVHLVTAPGVPHSGVLDEARRVLREGQGIEHATVQLETAGVVECRQPGW